MSEQPQSMEVFLDLLPNSPKNEQTRENLRELLRQRFEERLAPDVLKAMMLLDTLVEDTVSVLKEFETKDGAFVRKARPPKS